MKNKKFPFFLLLIIILISQASLAKTLFVAGDSTAAKYSAPDQQGWAALLQDYFDPQKIVVDNRAKGGRSTRTFISEGHWQALLDDLKADDIVIIQFGHNDASPINDNRRARGVIHGIGEDWVDIKNMLTNQPERVYSFGYYLRKMVREVNSKGAKPILINLTARNLWQSGRLERGFAQWGSWTYQVALATNSAFIDLTNPVVDKLEFLGQEKTAALYPKDYVHFNSQGASLHAETVVAALKGLRRVDFSETFSEAGRLVRADAWSWLRLPFPADYNRASIFLIGDSTVRNDDGSGANGQWGWGSFLAEALNSEKYNVVNRAVGGFSSRTFYTQQFDKSLMMLRPGDIVLMQFGHNDSAPINDDTRARGSFKGIGEQGQQIINQLTGKEETVHSYGWYLRQMVGRARARGAQVIICSPVPRKIWQGKFIKRAENSYATWAMQIARQSGAGFIDLEQLISRKYQQLGKSQVEAFFADKHTHTSKLGAELNAQIVAEHLKPRLLL